MNTQHLLEQLHAVELLINPIDEHEGARGGLNAEQLGNILLAILKLRDVLLAVVRQHSQED